MGRLRGEPGNLRQVQKRDGIAIRDLEEKGANVPEEQRVRLLPSRCNEKCHPTRGGYLQLFVTN